MENLSRRAYAKHRGVSESAVRRAITEGRITLEPDGKICPDKADKQWADNTGQTHKNAHVKKPEKIKSIQSEKRKSKPIQKKERQELNSEPESEEYPDADIKDTEASDPMSVGDEEPPLNNKTTFAEAKTANEILKAQTQKIKLAELKKELVNRENAVNHVFMLARAERDAWQGWPSRVAAELSSLLNVDQHKLHTLLDKYVREHLSELADVKPRLDK